MSTTIDQRLCDAYLDWRELSVAVQDTYDRWARAPRSRAAAAFQEYSVALDREERSSVEYSLLLGSLLR
jgi:hypothetical protein